MKQVRIIQMLMAVVMVLALGSCSSDDLSEVKNQNGKKTVKMEFVGNVIGFDQQGSSKAKVQTRATSSSWNDGDKIYITFYNGSILVPGEATYSSTSGWSVSYDGNLATGSNLKCEARYFVNATYSSSSLVSLNSNSEIYEDLNATYAYSNGSLTVAATLSPKTGRLRFTGEPGEKILTTGISVYTAFSPAINNYVDSDSIITSIVYDDGSTPYIYGYFTNNDRRIGLVGSDYAFTRTCTSSMFNVGESGYMAIPSESSHNNWRSGLYVKASGVEFKMIPVAGYSGGFFLMAETETTEALYKSVNGNKSSSQLPISNITLDEVSSFINKLKKETGLYFDLPSTDQWNYAASGGLLSQGFTYAGGNSPGGVAWYDKNSNGVKHEVKQKVPNELGIYDMSGNVFEMSYHQDPGGSGMTFYDDLGGGYFSTYNAFSLSGYNDISTFRYSTYDGKAYKSVGFRLILTFK